MNYRNESHKDVPGSRESIVCTSQQDAISPISRSASRVVEVAAPGYLRKTEPCLGLDPALAVEDLSKLPQIHTIFPVARPHNPTELLSSNVQSSKSPDITTSRRQVLFLHHRRHRYSRRRPNSDPVPAARRSIRRDAARRPSSHFHRPDFLH